MKRTTPSIKRAAPAVKRTALLAVAVATLALAGCAVQRLQTSKALAARAVAFQADPQPARRRLLVVGDSTAVGTGASDAAHSLPGLIGADHPDWRIENRAVNGARWADVLGQLGATPVGPDASHDLVLILAGGNDVMRGTAPEALATQVAQAVALAQQRARVVVLMPSGDVGHAPFFFAPVSWLMSRRSQQLHTVVAAQAQRSGSRYVRLLRPRASDPFVQDADRLNAADGLHPSDDGYRQWYAELQRQGGLAP